MSITVGKCRWPYLKLSSSTRRTALLSPSSEVHEKLKAVSFPQIRQSDLETSGADAEQAAETPKDDIYASSVSVVPTERERPAFESSIEYVTHSPPSRSLSDVYACVCACACACVRDFLEIAILGMIMMVGFSFHLPVLLARRSRGRQCIRVHRVCVCFFDHFHLSRISTKRPIGSLQEKDNSDGGERKCEMIMIRGFFHSLIAE